MDNKEKKLLLDIYNCINNIENYIESNIDFVTYANNQLLQDAVERNLITIGELPESDNKNTKIKKYVLVQNYVVPFGVKLSFPEPKVKDLTLIHKNKSFSLYSYPTN